jgi:hypothetical protein
MWGWESFLFPGALGNSSPSWLEECGPDMASGQIGMVSGQIGMVLIPTGPKLPEQEMYG